MKNLIKYSIAIIFIILTFMINNISQAKILAPKEADPLIYNGIKFTAPLKHNTFIEALDNKTGEKLWELQVYKIKINPLMEEDVQWIFIKNLEIQNGNLLITTTKNQKYLVNIEEKKVIDPLENQIQNNNTKNENKTQNTYNKSTNNYTNKNFIYILALISILLIALIFYITKRKI